MELIDTHAHLDFSEYYGEREQVIKRARDRGVIKIVNIGTDLSSSRRSLALSQQYQCVYAAVGVHPHNADEVELQQARLLLKDLAKADKVKAIGEIGLDFHYDNSPRNIQKEVFEELVELAVELQLPVIIHSREAAAETMEILEEYSFANRAGIMHCFAGDDNMAERALQLGFYIAVGGIITFKNSQKLCQTISRIPLERLLVETDCPFLTPEPNRGKRNEPAYVQHVVHRLADIKNVSPEEVAAQTVQNARDVFLF